MLLENEFLRVKVALRGAELCSLYDKRRREELIWQGDPTVWGWHAPLLFPLVPHRTRRGRVWSPDHIASPARCRAPAPRSPSTPCGHRPAPACALDVPGPRLGRAHSGTPAEAAPPSVRPCSVCRRNPRPSPGWRPASPAVVTNPPAPAICRLRPPLWCARKSGCWAPLRPRPFGRQPRGHAPENRKAPWGQ